MNSPKTWTRNDFLFHQQLGAGKFGVVYLAIEKKSERKVAIKVVPKNKIDSSTFHKRIQRQIEIHTRLKHKNICRMYGYFTDSNNLYMVLQYCKNRNLFTPIKIQKQVFSNKKIASIFKQLAQAVAYIHARNVIHRDIKLQNILYDQNYNIKLTDFGCCVHSTSLRGTFCGTIEYLCPQMLNEQNYGPQVDLYCLGVVLYQLFYYQTPFYDKKEEEMLRKIKQRDTRMLDQIRIIPDEAKELIQLLLLRDRLSLTFKHIFEHPFLRQYVEHQKQQQIKVNE